MPTHRRPAWLTRTRERGIWVAALTAVAILGGGAAYAVATGSPAYTHQCAIAESPKPGGGFTRTEDCDPIAAASTTPTGGTPSPSTSTSASPSSTPTVSPSPTPTTPGPSSTPTASPSTSPSSPTPSPSSTSGPTTNCIANPARCGFPDATNTGVPAGTQLTAVNGDLTITTANTVVTGKDVNGCIVVKASNVVIRNSRVNCPFNSAIRGTGIALVEDTEVICGPNGFTGISSALVIRRVHIRGCENGLDAINGMLVEDTYIHDLNGCCGNHTDGMQIDQVGGVVVRHNTVVGGPLPAGNAAITLWDEASGVQTHDLLITGNLLAGGGYTLRCGRYGTAVNVVVSGNRFVAGAYGYAWGCDAGGEVWSGNIDDAGRTLKAA